MLSKRRVNALLLVLLAFMILASSVAAADKTVITIQGEKYERDEQGIWRDAQGNQLNKRMNFEFEKYYNGLKRISDEYEMQKEVTYDKDTVRFIFNVLFRTALCFMCLIITVFFALDCVARGILLNKSGGGGWKYIIPFYGRYIEFSRYWNHGYYWTYIVLLSGIFISMRYSLCAFAIFTFIFFVFQIMFKIHLYKSFGKEPALVLADAFGFGMICDILIAFSDSTYKKAIIQESQPICELAETKINMKHPVEDPGIADECCCGECSTAEETDHEDIPETEQTNEPQNTETEKCDPAETIQSKKE